MAETVDFRPQAETSVQYSVKLNRSLPCSQPSSCPALAGTGGSAETSAPSMTAEAAVPNGVQASVIAKFLNTQGKNFVIGQFTDGRHVAVRIFDPSDIPVIPL